MIRDIGSTNGTYIGRVKVYYWTPLPVDAVIEIGRTRLCAADILPTAVALLHALVAESGYTEADVSALRMLAELGASAEKAAEIVLTARRRGTDPAILVKALIARRESFR